jgi:nitroreductase
MDWTGHRDNHHSLNSVLLCVQVREAYLDTLEAIKNRRSIRKYKPDPVDDKTLNIVLEAARLAPSWSNTQCWKFIVVRDNILKAQLAESIQINPLMGRNPATKAFTTAPVVIVACAEKGVSGLFNGKTATEKGEWWFLFDVALAMENLVLAATSLGLGTVHVALFDALKVASILGVPDGYHVVEMTPLGYPEYQPDPRPRKSLSQIVFHEKFGKNAEI